MMYQEVFNFYDGSFTIKEEVNLRLKFCIYKLVEDSEVERLKFIFKTPEIFKYFIHYLCMNTMHNYDDIIKHYSYIFDDYSNDLTNIIKWGVFLGVDGTAIVVCGEPIAKGDHIIMMNGKAYSHVSSIYKFVGVSMENGDTGDTIIISIL